MMKLSEETARKPPADLVALRIDGVVVAKLDAASETLWFRARQHGRQVDLSISVQEFIRICDQKGK